MSLISNHEIWLSVQTWSWGAIRSGVSKLPSVTCTRSVRTSSCMESVLPHSGQNPRSAYRDDRNLRGSPVIHVNASTGKCTKLRQGAPECFRQSSQWQITHRIGAAVDLYRMAPHRHPPSYVSGIGINSTKPDGQARLRTNRRACRSTAATPCQRMSRLRTSRRHGSANRSRRSWPSNVDCVLGFHQPAFPTT